MAQHIFIGTAKPSTAPTKVGQHFIDTTNKEEYISTGTASADDWKLSTNRYLRDFSFSDGVNPYISKTGSSYVVISRFTFAGTDSLELIKKVLIIAAENGTGNGKFRLYDATNAQTICEITTIDTLATKVYSTETISNLPTSEAVFEVQISHDSGTTYIASLKLE